MEQEAQDIRVDLDMDQVLAVADKEQTIAGQAGLVLEVLEEMDFMASQAEAVAEAAQAEADLVEVAQEDLKQYLTQVDKDVTAQVLAVAEITISLELEQEEVTA
jgi:hypothetical protein